MRGQTRCRRPRLEALERRDCPAGFGPAFGELVSTAARDIKLIKPILEGLGYDNFGDLISDVATTHAGGPNA